jgi:hypothetical protein
MGIALTGGFDGRVVSYYNHWISGLWRRINSRKGHGGMVVAHGNRKTITSHPQFETGKGLPPAM